MKNIKIYHRTVPNNKNQEKVDLLKFFSLGARNATDLVEDVENHTYKASDVAVIQGWVTDSPGTSQHLILRNTIIKNQIENKKYVITADSNLFLYKNTKNPLHYLRYSVNGIFPNSGIYCDSVIDPSRWDKISKNLNLAIKDYRKNGNFILLCLQRNGGWSMGNFDVQDWAIQTITSLRQHTNRPIVIRAHPGDKAAVQYLDQKNPKCKLKGLENVFISEFGRSLETDLQKCWAVVNHNSSPVVGAAIEGYPIFVTDPEKSQCKEIANIDLSKIENPNLPDRQAWVERLSMFHWNFDELKSGECWNHMRKFL